MDRYYKALGQVLGIAIILCFIWPKLGLAIIAATILIICAVGVEESNVVARIARRRREVELSHRADIQNRAFLRGDSYGLYGDFPPPPEMTAARRKVMNMQPSRVVAPVRDETLAWHHANLRRQG